MQPDEHGTLAPVPGYLTKQISAILELHRHDGLPAVEVNSERRRFVSDLCALHRELN